MGLYRWKQELAPRSRTKNATIKLDEAIKKFARVAARNGIVRGIVFENNIKKPVNSVEKPSLTPIPLDKGYKIIDLWRAVRGLFKK